MFGYLNGTNKPFYKDTGIVIYCAGNGDCQNTPFNVFQANCALLSDILQHSKFNRLVFMSSTRVYMNGNDTQENADLVVCRDDARRLFNLTKLVSEELCLKSGKDIVIVRPSNVYGVALNSRCSYHQLLVMQLITAISICLLIAIMRKIMCLLKT